MSKKKITLSICEMSNGKPYLALDDKAGRHHETMFLYSPEELRGATSALFKFAAEKAVAAPEDRGDGYSTLVLATVIDHLLEEFEAEDTHYWELKKLDMGE